MFVISSMLCHFLNQFWLVASNPLGNLIQNLNENPNISCIVLFHLKEKPCMFRLQCINVYLAFNHAMELILRFSLIQCAWGSINQLTIWHISITNFVDIFSDHYM